MRQRLLAALGVVAFGTLAAMPSRALAQSGVPSLCTPAITNVTSPDAQQQPVHYAAQGATVTVSGADFTQVGCTLNGVTVGKATIKPGTQNMTVSATSITFVLPAGASGAVSVSATDLLGNTGTSNSNLDFIETPTATLLAPQPVEGSTEPVSGSGYTPFLAQGGLPGAKASGIYTACAQQNQAFPATVADDADLSLSAPTTYCDGSLLLVFEAPYNTSKPIDCTDQPTAPAYNCIELLVNAGADDVYFFIASVRPAPLSSVPVGQVITIAGSGFGPSGVAGIAGTGAPTRWSDNSISVTVPQGALTGELILQRTTGDMESVPVGTFYIEKPGSPVIPPTPTPAPGGSGGITPPTQGSGVTGHAGRTGGPAAPTGATAADKLIIEVATTTAKPGAAVPFTVHLSVNGKPVSGAPVAVRIISAPGNDAYITDSRGITDPTGNFAGTLHLSKTAGQHIVLARSGVYTDEVTVLGSDGQTAGTGGVPFGIGPLNIRVSGSPVVVWLSLATGILLLAGIVVSLNVLRRFVWSVSGGPVMRRVRGVRAH